MPRALSLLTVLALLPTASAPAQDRPRPPVFSSRTELVLVDFVVTDKQDRVVEGLVVSDFVVKEDGKERKVVKFSAFSPAREAAAGPSDVVVEPFPSATPEPDKPPSSIAVLFVDDGQLSPQDAARLKPALKKLLDIMAGKNGALALVAPWAKVSLATAVAGNRALFAAAIDKIKGRRFNDRSSFQMSDAEAIAIERGDPNMLSRLTLRFVALNPGFDPDQAQAAARSTATEVAQAARIRRKDAYGVLLNSLSWLSRQPGRHSVVMVSGGFALDNDEDRDRQEITARSLEAKAPIHFLDARGMQGAGIFQGVEYGPALEFDAGEAPFAFSDAAEG
ncbi:MAG: VWA domain-containing protein, partial [Vicinamibacteria bacterium]